MTQVGIRSAMWVPLIVRERVVGVLSAGYSDPSRRYTPSDLNLMRELARRAALAVDNALLYRAIKRAETRQAAVASLGQEALAGTRYVEVAQSAAELLAADHGRPIRRGSGAACRTTRRCGWSAAWAGASGLVGNATVKAGLGSHGGYTLTTIGPVVLDDLDTETRFKPSVAAGGSRCEERA